MQQMELSAEGDYTFVPNAMQLTAYSSMVIDYHAMRWGPYQLNLQMYQMIMVIMQHKSQQVLTMDFQ